MIHLGDITKISGQDAPAVDVIIGGSPCQDLSVAGKRAGLTGERSGLYMEQIRVIREMREADVLRGRTDELVRPRYMVWENVPGAFSSNGGKDFAAVLEEAIRVAEPEAPDVCVPEKGWPTSGCFFDEMGRWSVAWRVLDAQFWGVPQRRRRIALVADFGGLSASEILFVRQSVSGYFTTGGTQREETAGDHGEGTGGAIHCGGMTLDDQGGSRISAREDGKSPTLRAEMHGNIPCVMGFTYKAGARAGSCAVEEEVGPTLLAGRNDAAVFDARGNGDGRIAPTITGDHYGHSNDYMGVVTYQRATGTLMANSHSGGCTGQDAFCDMLVAGTETVTVFDKEVYNSGINATGGHYIAEDGPAPTLRATGNPPGAVARHIVRRLTPLECERLQGYPDGWTDIPEWVDSKGKRRKTTDSARYKALGNSIAIPPWKWVLKRLCACYERDATMASLFDGIGGFPYIWEQLNGKGSCLWASEIEEFPMAVTKLRFSGGTR